MKKIQYAVFCIVKFFVKLFYPKTKIMGAENLPKEASIIVANHTQMNGPIVGELYFPGKRYIWCAGEMMRLSEVPSYAYKDFWSSKPRYIGWFYKLLSFIIAPLSVCVFNSAHTIAVYHDKRVISAFRDTIKCLKEDANVIVFPEHAVPRNHILCNFQEGFVDIAKIYYRQTGKKLGFVPMYIAPTLHTMYLGKPIEFNPDAPIKEERIRICEYLSNEITNIAISLPRHKVVPYNNLPKSQYPYNKDE